MASHPPLIHRLSPPMHVLLAPDSFKECLTARQVAEAMARGVERFNPAFTTDACPAADGGEGTCEALVAATQGQFIEATVTGPTGAPIETHYGLLGTAHTAVIETATAAGLALIPPEKRNPLHTTTFGVGELCNHALQRGATELLITLGGSGTTDGAAGLLQAMGLACFDEHDQRITQPLTGGTLHRIKRIDPAPLHEKLRGCTVRVACDVSNPLTGPDGAARVYGPQKGADPQAVKQLDAALSHWAELIQRATGRDIDRLSGAGAAGGMGGGLAGVLNAELLPGAALVLDAVGFDARLKRADLCLTGEGTIDDQTASGKLVMTIAHRASAAGVPTVALVGRRDASADALLKPTLPTGLDAIEVIAAGSGLSQAESIAQAGELMERAVGRVLRTAVE